MATRNRTKLRVEQLEGRDTPSALGSGEAIVPLSEVGGAALGCGDRAPVVLIEVPTRTGFDPVLHTPGRWSPREMPRHCGRARPGAG